MKKRNIILFIIAGVVVAGVVLYFLFGRSAKSSFQLDTITISSNDISVMVTATGTVEPITKVEVGTQVSGIISNIYVDYNSEVKKGQILAELDKVTLQSDLASKEMELKSAKVEYDYQKTNFERIQELFNKELISKTDYETAKYTYEKAEASYRRSSSDLIKTKTNLSYATITSPIDGVVLSRAVEEGQTVAASFNTPTLFTIANDLTKMQVIANVDEADIGEVKEGQRVSFTVDAYPTDIFEGSITQVRLEPTITSNVVTYEVIVNAPNPDLKLKPGLTANITVYTLEEKGINTLPNKVFTFQPDKELLEKNGYILSMPESGKNNSVNGSQKNVWVLNGNTISARTITTGNTDGINTEITNGLNNNDIVVTGVRTVKKATGNTSKESSPFMPQRPGGNRR